MLERADKFMDLEHARVLLAAGVAVVAKLTLSQVNTVLTTIVLVGTAIYTWRRALRRKPPKDEQ